MYTYIQTDSSVCLVIRDWQNRNSDLQLTLATVTRPQPDLLRLKVVFVAAYTQLPSQHIGGFAEYKLWLVKEGLKDQARYLNSQTDVNVAKPFAVSAFFALRSSASSYRDGRISFSSATLSINSAVIAHLAHRQDILGIFKMHGSHG